jgi:hypothetical protein
MFIPTNYTITPSSGCSTRRWFAIAPLSVKVGANRIMKRGQEVAVRAIDFKGQDFGHPAFHPRTSTCPEI